MCVEKEMKRFRLRKKSRRQKASRVRFEISKEKASIDNAQIPTAISGIIEKVSLLFWYCDIVPEKGRSNTGMQRNIISR